MFELLIGKRKTGDDAGVGFGIFGGGSLNGKYTDKYTYSSNTVVADTVLKINRGYPGATSSSPGGF